MGGVRVRLKFQTAPVRYARQCWFLFDPEKCAVAGDVAFLIAKHFGFKNTQGIQLYLDDYLIPANESAQIIRDNDTLVVKAVDDISVTTSDDSSIEEPPSKRTRLDTTKKKKRLTTKSQAKIQPQKGGKPTLLTNTAKTPVPVLKTVSKPSKLGGTHTKFHDASGSSESSGDDSKRAELHAPNSSNVTPSSAPKKQQQVSIQKTPPPRSAKKQNVNNTGRTSASKQKPGNKRRSFPLTVGGPSDAHTTKSVVYQQTVAGGGTGKDIRKSPGSLPKNKRLQESITPSKQTGESSKLQDEAKKTEESVKPPQNNENLKTALTTVEEPPPTPPLKDFSTLPSLSGAPRVGDSIAYKVQAQDLHSARPFPSSPPPNQAEGKGISQWKVLELSTGYTPEMSTYKEASVLSYDEPTKMVKLKLAEETVKAEQKKADKELAGKFSLEPGRAKTSKESLPQTISEEVVDMSLESLIEPKLIT